MFGGVFSKMFGGGVEEEPNNEDVSLGSAQKLPLPGKEAAAQQHFNTASPASTRAPEGDTPGSVTTPGTSTSSPDRQGLMEYPSPVPVMIKNTFFTTPVGRLDSLDGFFEQRGSRSMPATPVHAPPGLETGADDREASEEEAAERAEKADRFVTPQASPTAQTPSKGLQFMKPTLWPRTLSGDELESELKAMLEMSPPSDKTIQEGLAPPARSPDASPTKRSILKGSPDGSPRVGLPKPTFWPRTWSGDDLADQFGAMFSPSPQTSASAAKEGDNKDNDKAPEASPKATFKPMEWPRTMSGDDLEELARAAQQAATSAVKDGGVPVTPGSKKSANNKVCLSTTPSSKDQQPSAAMRNMVASPPQLPPGIKQDSKESSPPPPAPPSSAAPTFEEEDLPPPPEAPAAAPDAKKVSIADTLPEAEVGSAERPTRGSWGHSIGKCKPCAFQHTKGCSNGVECPFCHLCDRGEKKRRQREKWQAHRETVNAATATAAVMAQQQVMMGGMPPMGIHPMAAMSPVLGMPPVPPMPAMLPGLGMGLPGGYPGV